MASGVRRGDEMEKRFRVMLADDYDEELNAMAVIVAMLQPLTWDKKWRILNYILVRMLGDRGWGLQRPRGDNE